MISEVFHFTVWKSYLVVLDFVYLQALPLSLLRTVFLGMSGDRLPSNPRHSQTQIFQTETRRRGLYIYAQSPPPSIEANSVQQHINRHCEARNSAYPFLSNPSQYKYDGSRQKQTSVLSSSISPIRDRIFRTVADETP